MVVPADLPGRVLKPVYCVLESPVSAVGEIGYFAICNHVLPLSWQAAHPLVTPAWIWAVVGAGVPNSVPGAVRVAFAATRPDGIDPW